MKNLRNLALELHRAIGILAGLLLMVITLSGSALVFAPEIDTWLNPAVFKVTPQAERVAIASILQTIQTTYPEHSLVDVLMPKTSSDTYRIMADAYKFRIDADPYTGRILAARPWSHTFEGWMFELHSTLFAGKVGEWIVGSLGVLLLGLGLTGLMLFPGWKRFKVGWQIRWNAPKPVLNYDLHKVIGIISVSFIGMIAFTGVSLTFFSQFVDLTHWLTRTTQPPSVIEISASNQPPLSIEDLLDQADTALPGAKTVILGLPETPQAAFQVRKKFPQEWDEFGWSVVHLNQYTGKVLRIDSALDGAVAQQIVGAIYPLHVGAVGGLGIKNLYVLLGLTPFALFITGFTIWWSRTYGLQGTRRHGARKY